MSLKDDLLNDELMASRDNREGVGFWGSLVRVGLMLAFFFWIIF